MLSSLRSKILLSLIGTVFFSTLVIVFFVQKKIDLQISLLQNQNARHFSKNAVATIESHYVNLIYLEKILIEHKKKELQNIIDLSLMRVNDYYTAFLNGEINEDEAKSQAKTALSKIRYSNGGYVWINDTKRPFPQMIMHPIFPEIDGHILNDSVYNCALGKGTNLFVAAVDVATQSDQGFIDYLWPKPSSKGLTSKQEKLSLVKYFEEWEWVIGTGLYIGDIKKSVQERFTVIIDDLRESLSHVRVGESGYMFLFNGRKEMLIHPSLAGADFAKIINPTTGNQILDDLILSSKKPSKMLVYQWDKPPKDKGNFHFWKNSHIMYFEPFDWYIGSSVYADEIEAPAKEITRYILILSLGTLLFAFIISFLLSKNLTKPLNLLSNAGQKISFTGIESANVPVTGSAETRNLGIVLNQMLTSIKEHIRIQEDLFNSKIALEKRLQQAEKMESIGRLSAGVAHEINTPTHYVASNIEFINDASTDTHILLNNIIKLIESDHKAGKLDYNFFNTVKEYLDIADWEYIQEELPFAINQSKDGLIRISKIVSAMKTFTHPCSGDLEPSNINMQIESTVTIASNEWKECANVELLFEETLPLVPCYTDELNQVILNMIMNSVYAIRKSSKDQKGLISIETLTVDCAAHIRITDTGTGIGEDVIANIFDPFFTTKEVGSGTGQGLAISYDIITNKHKGTITVESELGEGTTFIISLPIESNNQS